MHVDNIANSPTNIPNSNAVWDSLTPKEKALFKIKPELTWFDDLGKQDSLISGHITFEENQERKKGLNSLMANVQRDLEVHRKKQNVANAASGIQEALLTKQMSAKSRAGGRATNVLFKEKHEDMKIAISKKAMKELVRQWRQVRRRERAFGMPNKREVKKVEEVVVVEEEVEDEVGETVDEEVVVETKPETITPPPIQETQHSNLDCTVVGVNGCTVRLLPSMTSKPIFLLNKGTKLTVTKRSATDPNRVFIEHDMKVQGGHTYVKKEPVEEEEDEEDEEDDEAEEGER